MREVSEAARRLRALRDRAGLSRAQIGALIGVPPTTYQSYETDYKKPYQPMPLVESLLPHLVGRGAPPITHADVLALAGPAELIGAAGKPFEDGPANIEERMLVRKIDPSPGDPIYDWDEAALLGLWRKLSRTKRAALFAYLGADDMPSLREAVNVGHHLR